jgi:hypothetical protein
MVTFAPNSSVREIQEFAFRGCSLASICVPASCLKIDWNCFSYRSRETEVTFESPVKIQSILGLKVVMVKPLELPDSAEIVTVVGGADPGFGRESQLRHPSTDLPRIKGVQFMRISEPSLNRI